MNTCHDKLNMTEFMHVSHMIDYKVMKRGNGV